MSALKSYQSENLQSSKIRHGFYSRLGGVSDGIYQGLNLGYGSDDPKEHVDQNYDLLQQGLDAQHILTCHQIHSDQCHVVTVPWHHPDRPKGDAMVTDHTDIAIGVLTADCAPVLFSGLKDNGMPVIGAAHAGWKGTIGGVLESTLLQMVGLGAASETIKAAVGPCIAQKSYEVSAPFLEPFIKESDENDRFFAPGQNADHFMFDLSGYVAARMARAGLKDIALLDQDTYSNEAEFYSYRRKTHRNEPDYGRQISVIVINS